MSRRVVVIGVCVWIVLIGVAAELVALRGAPPEAQPARTLSTDVDAAGLQSIELRATDGAIEVVGTDEDRIRISTEISTPTERRRWMGGLAADLARVELVTGRSGDVFTARLRVPGSDAVVERWTIHLPRRFKVRLDANDSLVSVSDVSGGVSVRANAGIGSEPGAIRVNVPGGRLDLSLHVGDIHARTSSASRGPVDVESSVGDARLTVAGRSVVSPRAPGPGHRLQLNDAGPDPVKLHVGVGTATLDIK